MVYRSHVIHLQSFLFKDLALLGLSGLPANASIQPLWCFRYFLCYFDISFYMKINKFKLNWIKLTNFTILKILLIWYAVLFQTHGFRQGIQKRQFDLIIYEKVFTTKNEPVFCTIRELYLIYIARSPRFKLRFRFKTQRV